METIIKHVKTKDYHHVSLCSLLCDDFSYIKYIKVNVSLSAGDEELITDLELHQPINIESACGTPPYTNFTQGFQETLDYIFIDSDTLTVTKVVPLPSHEDVTANVGLPSIVFPSDHLALICDLTFRH